MLTALASLAVITLISLPVLGLRLGTSDASTDPASWTTHQSYAALADGFGPGFNGPFELVGQVRNPGDLAAFDRLLATAAHAPGVARATAAQISPDHQAVIATLYPATAPQDQQTVTLVNSLRDSLIPQAEHGNSLIVHVGGQTATAIDFAHVLGSKLPLFVAVVVILAFVLLTAVFRSLLIPLVASALNLLSVVAALGRHDRPVHQRLGRLVARPVRHRAGGRVPARRHVLGPVRPVHGLRGLHRQPHARGMAAPAVAPGRSGLA